MLISYEDAYFYKILLQTGFVEEVNQWIDNIANNNEKLEDINLELVCLQGDTNKVISCLHNYIGKKIVDDEILCNRLRLFIKCKIDNEELTIEKAAESLSSFSLSSEKIYEEYWNDFYILGAYGDLVAEGLIAREKYNAIARQFIVTGNKIDTDDFWSTRANRYETFRKKERKYKIFYIVGLVLYSIFIMFLSFLFMKLENSINGTLSIKTLEIHITVMCLLIVPPAVIGVVCWDRVYDFLTRCSKKKRERIKKEKEILENKNKKASDELREMYNLPDNILTQYEHYTLFSKSFFSRWKWILLGICEFLCLAATIGSVFYFDLVSLELGVTIILLGIVLGIYGFTIICNAPVKGILYSALPVLCYALPLVIVYYLIGIKTEWIIGLSTVVFGSILFALFICFVVVIPYKRYNKACNEYWNLLEEKYPKIKHPREYSDAINNLTFWKKDGTHISICEVREGYSSIILTGKIRINNIEIKDAILYYVEENDIFENCVEKGIEIIINGPNNY